MLDIRGTRGAGVSIAVRIRAARMSAAVAIGGRGAIGRRLSESPRWFYENAQ